MRRESKFAVSCVWSAGRLRLRRDVVPGWLHSICALGAARLDPMPELREQGHCPQGPPFPGVANRADWFETGLSGDRGAQMPVWGLRQTLRGLPPFASGYVSYTR